MSVHSKFLGTRNKLFTLCLICNALEILIHYCEMPQVHVHLDCGSCHQLPWLNNNMEMLRLHASIWIYPRYLPSIVTVKKSITSLRQRNYQFLPLLSRSVACFNFVRPNTPSMKGFVSTTWWHHIFSVGHAIGDVECSKSLVLPNILNSITRP